MRLLACPSLTTERAREKNQTHRNTKNSTSRPIHYLCVQTIITNNKHRWVDKRKQQQRRPSASHSHSQLSLSLSTLTLTIAARVAVDGSTLWREDALAAASGFPFR